MIEKTPAQIVAMKVANRAFDGRKGAGGDPPTYRQMSRAELEGWLQVAYILGTQHGALAAESAK